MTVSLQQRHPGVRGPLLVLAGLLWACDAGVSVEHDGGLFTAPDTDGAVGRDASGGDGAGLDRDASTSDAGLDGGPGGNSSPFTDGYPWSMLDAGTVCTLSVGATCDGPEDCPRGQSCCGRFDTANLRYTSIGCADRCESDDIEFCHSGDACSKDGTSCRTSVIIPSSEIGVCALSVPGTTPASAPAVAGKLACGERACNLPDEQCCFRTRLNWSRAPFEALEPFCAPRGSECDCDTEPPPQTLPGPDGGVSDDDAGL